MLKCREATRLLSESQERALTLKEKMALRTHTMMCAGCRNFGKQMGVLRLAAREFAGGKREQKSK